MSKHTKGPWGFEESYKEGVGNFNLLGQGMILAKMQMYCGDVEANKALIVAAPEMLEALLAARTFIEETMVLVTNAEQRKANIRAGKVVEDAIKKARG